MSRSELDPLTPYNGTIASIVEPGSLGLSTHNFDLRVAVIEHTVRDSEVEESWLPVLNDTELHPGQTVTVTPVVEANGKGTHISYELSPQTSSYQSEI